MTNVREVERPHAMPAAEVLSRLATDPGRGLASAEVAVRLARYGRNELPAAAPVPRWRRFLAQFDSPLVLLLIAAAAISLGVWWHEGAGHAPYEALAIAAIILANATIGFIQEERAGRAVAALKGLTAALAVVVREGTRMTVPATEVVPGDLIVIEEGAKIPADARVVQSASLRSAEAALTGESAPVEKSVEPVADGCALPDRACMVYSGTAAVYGHGLAVVTATGPSAEIGRIAGLLAATASQPTPLQRQLAGLGKVLGAAVITIAAIVAAAILAMTPVHTTAVFVSVLLFAIALAVAAVPEGLSAVTTIVLSIGTQRMAARNAIVRTLAAVETLGSATVICTDKTGTLTRNEMTVRAVVTASGLTRFTGTGYAPEGGLFDAGGANARGAPREETEWALTAAQLCSNAAVSVSAGRWSVLGDPAEGALEVAVLKAGLDPAQIKDRYPRTSEIPFSAARKLMSTLHQDSAGAILITKGAPDLLLALCARERVGDTERLLTAGRRAEIQAEIDKLAGEALRTLGLASHTLPAAAAATQVMEQDLTWLGVAGMMDPPRPEAATAVRNAREAGVRVVMITGDHPATASAIAAELGIARQGEPVLTGADLERMSETELAAATTQASVYARVSPEHKLAIVRALHARGEIVAMTGDGVNDAPALKAADIGIAMGVTGTDVAKEAADIVLADDNFASIVAAIEEGRAIYANIQGFLRFLLATNAGEVVVMFFGVVLAGVLGLAGTPGEALVLPLLATQILWINLVTDSFPALAVGVDPADPRVMSRPPRDPRAGVITRRMWQGIAVAAPVMGIGTLLLLDAGLPGGLIEGHGTVDHARTMAFNALVLFQLYYAFCVRSDQASSLRDLFRNRWLWIAAAVSLALQAAVIHVPALQRAFGTVALGPGDWFLCAAVASTVVFARASLKTWWRHVDRKVAPEVHAEVFRP